MKVGIIIYLVLVVLTIAAIWKVYTKAGKSGWSSLIPIYATIVKMEIVGKPAIWVLLYLFLAPIFGIWVTNLLSKSFGKGVGFTIGLLLLPFIFYPILGFGDAKYEGPAGK